MKQYQREAVKLAGEILSQPEFKTIYRVCPICGKATDEIDKGDGDKYGPVYHTKCYKARKRG